MKEEELQELIDLYLKGRLPEDHPFGKMLEEDKTLQGELEVHRLVKNAFVDHNLLTFQRDIQSHHQLQIQNSHKISNTGKKIITIGILVIISALLTYFVYEKIYITSVKQEKSASLNASPEKLFLSKDPGNYKSYTNQKPIHEITAVKPFALGKATDTFKESNVGFIIAEKEIKDQTQLDKLSLAQNQKAEQSLQIGDNPSTISNPIEMNEGSSKAADPCLNIKIGASIISEPPCKEKDNGIINIENVHGGTAPYLYSVDDGKNYQSKNIIRQLTAGTYGITVMDNNKCFTAIDPNYYLDSKDCSTSRNFSFNPQYSTLDIIREIAEDGKLQIYDKNTRVVIYRNISAAEVINWDGTQDGALLPPGLYMYTLLYNSGKVEQGSITLLY